MAFNSVTFLILFLPLSVGVNFLLPTFLRNAWIFFVSMIFYAWPDPSFLPILLGSIFFNWIAGISLTEFRSKKGRTITLVFGVSCNLLALLYFKYANLFVSRIKPLWIGLRLDELEFTEVALPPGVSFFTFHAISYLVDVYRNQAVSFRNPLKLGVYLALFPQLISGPIVRFRELAGQIEKRFLSIAQFSSGVDRFVFGLAKKVLIADPLGKVSQHVFSLPMEDLSTKNAWYGLACYSLQIYFDFSGYSDMAIGLGRFFGFELVENFHYPYSAKSVREFWRRWHISLSSWFRDYVYVPLGGNRVSVVRTYGNLVTVFFLCGLWHGASWAFVVWGLYHGMFLVLERLGLGRVADVGCLPEQREQHLGVWNEAIQRSMKWATP